MLSSSRVWLATALFAAATAPLGAAAPTPRAESFLVDEARDLSYGADSKRQALDVYRPRGVERRPVVLFAHGGAWMFGDKNFFGLYRGVGQHLARHGMVAVMINYRLSPAVQHPAHVQDVARAFAWTRKNIAKHGGDPDRIVLAGHSAGAHLVALLATDPAWLKDPALELSDRDRAAIRGVVPVSGVYRIPGSGELARAAVNVLTLLALNDAAAATRDATARAQEFNPFRVVFGDDPNLLRQASPIHHVRGELPPFLVVYAERELPTLAPMAREFAAALKTAGATAEVRKIPDCHHNTILFRMSEPGDPMADALVGFVRRVAEAQP